MTTKKEMLDDIKKMLLLIEAFTHPCTEGEDYLNELKKKYNNK